MSMNGSVINSKTQQKSRKWLNNVSERSNKTEHQNNTKEVINCNI